MLSFRNTPFIQLKHFLRGVYVPGHVSIFFESDERVIFPGPKHNGRSVFTAHHRGCVTTSTRTRYRPLYDLLPGPRSPAARIKSRLPAPGQHPGIISVTRGRRPYLTLQRPGARPCLLDHKGMVSRVELKPSYKSVILLSPIKQLMSVSLPFFSMGEARILHSVLCNV